MPEVKPLSPLAYAMRETKVAGEKLSEQTAGLSDEDKARLRAMAVEEMTVLGIPIKDAKDAE